MAKKSKEALRQEMLAAADRAAPAWKRIALEIHANPEIGHEERKAAAWLCGELERSGFRIRRGVADLPTAFVAEKGGAAGAPSVAFVAEYDALKGLGHACGHNLMGPAACLAGIALAAGVGGAEAAGGEARVLVIGTPAEEGPAGKIPMVEAGVFAGVDVALMAHASSRGLTGRNHLGCTDVVLEFRGQAAHASAWPDRGINALDAMILTFSGVGLMRQQLRDRSRVHGVITHGGHAANIVPDYTRAEFLVRSRDTAYMDELRQRLISCAEGAARATGASLAVSVGKRVLPTRRIPALEESYAEHYRALGGEVCPEPDETSGSTDFGNLSNAVPAIHAYFRMADREIVSHSPEFAEASGTPRALDALVHAAKALALTGLDFITDPGMRERVRREFGAAGPTA